MRKLRGRPDVPFGGCVVVLLGDVKQLLQITEGHDAARMLRESIVEWQPFRDSRKHFLRRQHRVADADWNRFALEVGYGVLASTTCDACDGTGTRPTTHAPLAPAQCEACVGLGFCVDPSQASADNPPVADGNFEKSIEDLRVRSTSDVAEALQFLDRSAPRDVAIAFHNLDVDAHNECFVPGPDSGIDVVTCEASNLRSPDLHDVDPSAAAMLTDEMMARPCKGLPPSQLRLWKGARVMLIRNMWVPAGLFNGQMLEVVEVTRFMVSARIVDPSGRFDTTQVHHIPRCKLEGLFHDVPFNRVQFPLKLAYAITANKSQGQTLTGRVVLDLRRPSFAPGQLYVALTRVKSADQIMLLLDEAHHRVLYSVVLQAVLQAAGDVPLARPAQS